MPPHPPPDVPHSSLHNLLIFELQSHLPHVFSYWLVLALTCGIHDTTPLYLTLGAFFAGLVININDKLATEHPGYVDIFDCIRWLAVAISVTPGLWAQFTGDAAVLSLWRIVWKSGAASLAVNAGYWDGESLGRK